jgi:hypothetical protein
MGSLTSFGVDENQELYWTSSNGKIYKFAPTVTSIETDTKPSDYFLEQNYPNPFNPATTIKYQLGNDGFVKLKIFNSLGEEVAELVNEFQKGGNYQLIFNADNLPSGIYVYQLSTGSYKESKKMIIMK